MNIQYLYEMKRQNNKTKKWCSFFLRVHFSKGWVFFYSFNYERYFSLGNAKATGWRLYDNWVMTLTPKQTHLANVSGSYFCVLTVLTIKFNIFWWMHRTKVMITLPQSHNNSNIWHVRIWLKILLTMNPKEKWTQRLSKTCKSIVSLTMHQWCFRVWPGDTFITVPDGDNFPTKAYILLPTCSPLYVEGHYATVSMVTD